MSWFAKKKFEKTFIIAKAGKPKLKKYRALAEFKTEHSLNCPYPKSAEIISSDAIKEHKIVAELSSDYGTLDQMSILKDEFTLHRSCCF